MVVFGDDFDEDVGFGFNMSPLLDLPPEAEAHVRRLIDGMRKPLAAGDPRRHHFVPQFFLRRFSAGDQIARVLLTEPKRHQIAQVKDVAVIKDLYTSIDVDVGETVAVERLLSVIDGEHPRR